MNTNANTNTNTDLVICGNVIETKISRAGEVYGYLLATAEGTKLDFSIAKVNRASYEPLPPGTKVEIAYGEGREDSRWINNMKILQAEAKAQTATFVGTAQEIVKKAEAKPALDDSVQATAFILLRELCPDADTATLKARIAESLREYDLG